MTESTIGGRKPARGMPINDLRCLIGLVREERETQTAGPACQGSDVSVQRSEIAATAALIVLTDVSK
jgi:hypothetical protein